jgi:diaminopimelate decarboxylase
MHTLDIGGGFPAGDIPQSTVEALKSTFNDPLNYRVIAEPGRYLSSRCFFLATRIIGVRTKSGKTCFHLNDSVYHTFNCVLMDNVNLDNSEQFYSKI